MRPNIPTFDRNMAIDESWFSFICLYIQRLFEYKLKLLKESNIVECKLHQMKAYYVRMEPHTDLQQRLDKEVCKRQTTECEMQKRKQTEAAECT